MQWLLVQEGPNPSSDFFIVPHLKRLGATVHYATLAQAPQSLSSQSFVGVVFCRYINSAWLHWLQLPSQQGLQVAFFIDDDLFSGAATADQPWRYQYKLWRYGRRFESLLKRLDVVLWVANDYLRQRNQGWADVQILSPCNPHVAARKKTVFYHGSASHQAELDWLIPIWERLDAERSDVHLEVIGPKALRDRYRHISSMTVLQPMKWPAYQALIGAGRREIGLAPLCASDFNNGRSATKFYDITQAQAVGVYADDPVYHALVQSHHNGVSVPMTVEAWYEAIECLLNDEVWRLRLFAGAQEAM